MLFAAKVRLERAHARISSVVSFKRLNINIPWSGGIEIYRLVLYVIVALRCRSEWMEVFLSSSGDISILYIYMSVTLYKDNLLYTKWERLTISTCHVYIRKLREVRDITLHQEKKAFFCLRWVRKSVSLSIFCRRKRSSIYHYVTIRSLLTLWLNELMLWLIINAKAWHKE